MSIDFRYLAENKLQNIQIVELGEDDCEKVIGLINAVQPHIPWNEEHFHWQYFGRTGFQPKLFGAMSEKNLIGFYAAVHSSFLLEDEVRNVFMVQDVMTAETFRGRGILHLLGEMCSTAIDGCEGIGLTFPNEKSAGSFRRIGWTEVMGVPLLEAKCKQFSGKSSTLVSEISRFETSVNEIWTYSGLQSGIHRDAGYLNWRYSKPGVQYLKFLVGNRAGYFVLKLFTGGKEPRVHLLDLVLKEMDIELAGEVVEFILSTATDLGASSVTCWLPVGHMYENYFVNQGFSRVNMLNRSVFLRGVSVLDEVSQIQSGFHISQGDSDVF
jgi:hypothetical protein